MPFAERPPLLFAPCPRCPPRLRCVTSQKIVPRSPPGWLRGGRIQPGGGGHQPLPNPRQHFGCLSAGSLNAPSVRRRQRGSLCLLGGARGAGGSPVARQKGCARGWGGRREHTCVVFPEETGLKLFSRGSGGEGFPPVLRGRWWGAGGGVRTGGAEHPPSTRVWLSQAAPAPGRCL